jgi:hypothetical protein
MRLRCAIIAFPLLVVTTVARADVSAQWIDRGVPTNGSIIATGYHAVTLRLVSDTGPITAIDFWTEPRGFAGSLVQRWDSSGNNGDYDVSSPGPLTAQNLINSPFNFDSHFLAPANNPDGALVVFMNENAAIGPTGTQIGTFPVNSAASGIGLGSKLRGEIGIIGAYQSSVFDTAYLVVPDGTSVSFQALIATRDGTFSAAGSATVLPEPATACGLLPAIWIRLRRRR